MARHAITIHDDAREPQDRARLAELLSYNPDNGKLYWRKRDARWFFDAGNQTAESICAGWNKRLANKEAFTATGPNGYRYGAIFGRSYLAHRVAWAIHHEEWPSQMLDHKNGDRADNRICNLRLASKSENSQNITARRDNLLGVIGVSRTGNKFRAEISVDGKRHHLGYFESLEAAAEAYQSKKREIHTHHRVPE